MKKTKPYYLKFYKEWMKTGRMRDASGGGLCNLLHSQIRDFIPSGEEFPEHYVDGFPGYWGYNGEPATSHRQKMESFCAARGISRHDLIYAFTPLRQTIVLFLAAMNNEL